MIYPDIDSIRRCSVDQFDKLPPGGGKQGVNVFAKAPKLTRQFFNKLGPNTTTLFGWEFRARQIWLLAGFLLLFSLGLAGSLIMWTTSMFDQVIFSNLVIGNSSDALALWLKPPVTGLTSIYLFNYTNVDEYRVRKTDVLKVEEVGPYVYEEVLERVNVRFLDQDRVQYQEKRTYKFRPDLSKGHRQSDRLVVPNVPLLSGAALNRNAPYLQRLAVDTFVFSGLSEEVFIELPAQKYIFGYEDNLFTISKQFVKTPSEQFGLMAHKLGVSQDVITVNTGASDINKLGLVEELNGAKQLNHWSTEDCNSFKGTDGMAYPPRFIRNKQPVHIFSQQFCHAVPMHFEREVAVVEGTVPAYRYRLPDDVFASPEVRPEMQCYCDMSSGECAPAGLFNITPCAYGAPLFLSLPHFFGADPQAMDGLTGLKPSASRHRSHADFHPTMGFAMGGVSRFQANVQMIKTFGMDSLSIFQRDEMMLPLCWVELLVDGDNLPEAFRSLIYTSTFTVKGVELGLKYGCLLTCAVTMMCVAVMLRARRPQRV